jgi:hypothetical protein
MGAAFMVALVLIYGLIVWEFKNFAIAGIIMAPIPLTLIGIIPGHWILGAEFTATSMIGFIALAGIIVRNSILLVEFVKNEVAEGKDVVDAVISAGQVRMRPIFITALTLMAGAAAILNDPIFQGMAAGLLFGTGVATILTLIVIPLGCISAGKQFYLMNEQPFPDKKAKENADVAATPIWVSFKAKFVRYSIDVFDILQAIVSLLREAVESVIQRFNDSDNKQSDVVNSENITEDEQKKAEPVTKAKKKTSRKKKVIKKETVKNESESKKEDSEKENIETRSIRTTKKKRRGIKLKNIEQKKENKDDEKE